MRLRPLRFLPESGIAGGTLPWVIGVMVYLSVLAAGFGFALNHAIGDWAADLSGRLSVQIFADDDAAAKQQAAAVTDLLGKTPGVRSVARVSAARLSELLEPWLGAGNVTDDLPLPILLEVTLVPGATLDTEALAARLRTRAPALAIDDHAQWLADVRRLAGSLELTAAVIVALVLAATAAIATFGTRAGLAGHRDSVEILHLMGAEDSLIAGEFRYRFMIQGLKGGAGGLVFGLVTLFGIDYLAGQLGRGLMPSLSLDWTEWLMIASLPGFAACLTMIAAHLTVHRELARLP
ncbi:MAG: cell division protein FtsX [Rhodothalassiaceae bacterium]